MSSEETDECYIDVDDLDVTNLQEAILFTSLFFVYLALIYKAIVNLQTVAIMQKLPNRCDKSLRRIKLMNILILVPATFEIIQKIESVGFYIFMYYNGRTFETVMLATKIYVILCSCKMATHYILLIANAYLWYFAITTNHCSNNKQNMIRFIWKYIIPAIFIIVYAFNVVSYLFCKYSDARSMNLVLTTTLTMVIFFGSIWKVNKYFDNDPKVPKSFKLLIRRSSHFLYFSILFRITYFILLFVYDDKMEAFKQYDNVIFVDNGFNWFAYLIVFQILVNFFPLWYLTMLFSPKINQEKFRAKTQESTQIISQPLIFPDKIQIPKDEESINF